MTENHDRLVLQQWQMGKELIEHLDSHLKSSDASALMTSILSKTAQLVKEVQGTSKIPDGPSTSGLHEPLDISKAVCHLPDLNFSTPWYVALWKYVTRLNNPLILKKGEVFFHAFG
jgi:hypothetical protein